MGCAAIDIDGTASRVADGKISMTLANAGGMSRHDRSDYENKARAVFELARITPFLAKTSAPPRPVPRSSASPMPRDLDNIQPRLQHPQYSTSSLRTEKMQMGVRGAEGRSVQLKSNSKKQYRRNTQVDENSAVDRPARRSLSLPHKLSLSIVRHCSDAIFLLEVIFFRLDPRHLNPQNGWSAGYSSLRHR